MNRGILVIAILALLTLGAFVGGCLLQTVAERHSWPIGMAMRATFMLGALWIALMGKAVIVLGKG